MWLIKASLKNPYMVAAYVAMVGADLASKELAKAEELSRQKLFLLERLKSFLIEASTGRTPLLAKLIKGEAHEKLKEVKELQEQV